LVRFLGNIGTAALLFVAFLAYIIWQFNPVFKLPKKLQRGAEGEKDIVQADPEFATIGKTVNDAYAETNKGNSLKGDARLPDGQAKLYIVSNTNEQNATADLNIVEKDYDDETNKAFEEPAVTKEVVADIMHSHDIPGDETIKVKPRTKVSEKQAEELE